LFVSSVRKKQAILNDFDAAVDAALNEMPEESALRAFMTANRAEVKRMCITEYNEVKTMADEREEGRKEGLMEGRMEGVIETLLSLVRKGLISEERAAEEAHMSVSQFREQARLA
jgi:predicted transposase YdaD